MVSWHSSPPILIWKVSFKRVTSSERVFIDRVIATVSMWNEMGILNQLLKYKLLFVETSDFAETSLALDNYRKACDSGRGRILYLPFMAIANDDVCRRNLLVRGSW